MKRTNEVTEVRYWLGEWAEDLISRYLGEDKGFVGPPTKTQIDRFAKVRDAYHTEA